MRYERIAGSPVDLIRTDKKDLTLASAGTPSVPGHETALSTVAFPVVKTNQNQDSIISSCYMGDYNNIASNGTARFVTWCDNRNQVTTTAGTENEPDVFLQKY